MKIVPFSRPTLALALIAVVAGSTLFSATAPTVHAQSNPAVQLLPGGIRILRDRPLTKAQELFEDVELQQLASNVATFCIGSTTEVPDLEELVEHLEGLYDHVWQTTSPAWKYKYSIDPSGEIVQVCYIEHRIFALNNGEAEPVIVEYSPSMTL